MATYTEFYCNASTGSNLNGGSDSGSVKLSHTNGGWDSTTGIFSASDGTDLSAVSIGDFASVYVDGATVGVFIARVTAVNNSDPRTITVSLTAKGGTAPTTSATGRSIRIGGAWKGPNAADSFPFLVLDNTATNTNGDVVRVNFKNNAVYSLTAGVAVSKTTIIYEGYSATPGDGGRAIFDGGSPGSSYTMLTANVGLFQLRHFVLRNNGTGALHGISTSGAGSIFYDIVIYNIGGRGISCTANFSSFIECELYNCNSGEIGNTAANALVITGASSAIRCTVHDSYVSGINVGSSASGGMVIYGCIVSNNDFDGFYVSGVGSIISGCDVFANGNSGVRFSGSNGYQYVENCNFVDNFLYGFTGSNHTTKLGYLLNCGFGSGAYANNSGDTNEVTWFVVDGSVSYTTHPYADPVNGDFDLVDTDAWNAGRGGFTQTASGYTGTTGYPDIGASQHDDTQISEGGGGDPPIVVSSRGISGLSGLGGLTF